MEDKKYTIMEFVTECVKVQNNPVALKKLLAEIHTKTYVPFGQKVYVAKKALANICLGEDGFQYNSPKRYLAFVMSIIELYTDLEMTETDTSLEYDALKSSGLMTAVLEMIGEEDFKEYKSIWKMSYEDLIASQTSIPSLIKENVKRFANICDAGFTALSKQLERIPTETLTKKFEDVINKAKKQEE